MGCFSYICKECGKGIQSSSSDGQPCRIGFLLNGQVQQEMSGRYDSYGRVFNEDSSASIEWDLSDMDWGEMIDTHFSPDWTSGFYAVHKKCDRGVHYTNRSENDPNQGWGEDSEVLDFSSPNNF